MSNHESKSLTSEINAVAQNNNLTPEHELERGVIQPTQNPAPTPGHEPGPAIAAAGQGSKLEALVATEPELATQNDDAPAGAPRHPALATQHTHEQPAGSA